jgi:hypothetical protein
MSNDRQSDIGCRPTAVLADGVVTTHSNSADYLFVSFAGWKVCRSHRFIPSKKGSIAKISSNLCNFVPQPWDK